MNQIEYLETPLPIHDMETGKQTGYVCRSGQHQWLHLSDANKCCHPNWRRAQRIVKSLTGFGITYLGYTWVRSQEHQA